MPSRSPTPGFPMDSPVLDPRPVTESQILQWGHRAAVAPTETVKFLEGPQPRSFELWRSIQIFRELIYGFRKLHFVGPCVTVFGSARFAEGHPFYKQARLIGRHLAEQGFTVMTGGGPGIMEAANRGAKDVKGGRSIGCNIKLPKEQKPNPYVDRFIDFEHFFIRKLMLIKYSYGFVVCPGGFGTLDELFEVLTLIQTGKLLDFPVALVGREFWAPGIAQLRKFVAEKTIDPVDLDKLYIGDDPDEVVQHITSVAKTRFGLSYGKRMKPRWWLGEGWLR
jgi:uncharacterized protein (TIGR00730 family)